MAKLVSLYVVSLKVTEPVDDMKCRHTVHDMSPRVLPHPGEIESWGEGDRDQREPRPTPGPDLV